MSLIAITLAIAAGAAMGLFGAGGSLFLVPALTYVMSFEAKQAVTISLAVVGMSAFAGAVAGYLKGTLPLRPAIVTGTGTIVGAFLGSIVGAGLDDGVQLTMLGCITLAAAAILTWQSASPRSKRLVESVSSRAVLMAAAGLGVGFITGLVGVGGGFLIVPALVTVAGLEMREAASVSLFVIVLATLSALTGYAGRVPFSWGFVAPFAMVATLATVAGGIARHSMSQRLLQRMFAGALVVVAAFLLIRN